MHLRIQTSVQGRPRALGWGRTRVSGNLLFLGNFLPYPVASIGLGSSATHAGKGGLFGGGGGGNPLSVTWSWNYLATVVVGFGDSQVASVQTVYSGSSISNNIGATLYAGDYTQTTWPYTDSFDPGQSLAYRGESYLAYGPMLLGSSASLPNNSYEVTYAISFDLPWVGPDANPADVIYDYLTSPDHGVPGWTASLLGDLTDARLYFRAFSLLVSFSETQQRSAASFLQDFAKVLNVDYRWSGGQLSVVPLTPFNGYQNGYMWVAPTTPLYDLTDNDFLPVSSSSSSPTISPITIARKPRSQIINHIRVEYLARGNYYNPHVLDHIDEGSVVNYGLERVSDVISAHYFCLDQAASMSAGLMAQRNFIVGTYKFTVGRRFILLDPMDVVTITENNLGFLRVPVRITEIQENSDGTLAITAEDYPVVPTAPAYGVTATKNMFVDYNAAPGPINVPLIFEPPDVVAGGNGLAVWIGISGQNTTTWGGCDAYVSYDGLNYTSVGRIEGPTRMGVLSAPYPAVTPQLTGQTIDGFNTLSVDLTQSAAALASATQADMLGLNSLCYVDGELIAYQTATLTASYKYNLLPNMRGAYGSTIGAHAAGTKFARLDSNIIAIPFTADRIGATIYLKFLSFNAFGGGHQQLSEVSAQTYQITGAALSSPLPSVPGIRSIYSAGFMQLWWDEINDFRTGIRYEIRKGPSYQSSMQIGDVAHPPFQIFGDDIYWLTAYTWPAPGLKVQSYTPASLTVAGNQLVDNVVISRNEQTVNWPGTLTNLATQGSPGSYTLVLNQSSPSGSYEIPMSEWVDVGYQAKASVNVVWSAVGSPVGQNILAMTNILGQSDILGSYASAFVTSWIEIAVAADVVPNSDVFAAPDVFSSLDVFGNPAAQWSPWQKFVPGTYLGRWFKFRLMVQNSNTAQVTATVLAMRVTISVPPRIDHYQNQSIAAGGTTIVFMQDGSTVNRKFTGGPNNSPVPYWNVSYPNQPNDTLLVTGLSLSQMTIQILNGGVGVARTGVNIDVEGY